MAESLKRLTEVIAAEGAMEAGAKQEAIEVVSALAEELAEERRPSRVRAFLTRIGQLLAGGANLYGAYEGVKFAVRAAGYELP